jgi:two-component system response regulator AtoC
MDRDLNEEKQPWATCLFTDILLSYLEESGARDKSIDYRSLFSGVEGIEIPSDPKSFLKDVNNWVPLPVYRELLSQCEKISGKKDMAYEAARAYFDPGKKHLPTLIELIMRVLNNPRSALICSNLWGTVQTNYLKLQSFERPGSKSELYMLAKFHDNARPTPGAIHLVRGICEGLVRLYPFVEELRCVEEISQVRIEDIIPEFPDFRIAKERNELIIYHRASQQPVAKAAKIPLRSEVVSLSQEFLLNPPETTVVHPQNGQIPVLTNVEETDPGKMTQALSAYKIVHPGVISLEARSYSFDKGHIYNAPYCCFRIMWKENLRRDDKGPAEEVRKEISSLLFEHLKQMKQAQTRMFQVNVEKRRLTLENIRLRQEIERGYSFSGIIGQSERMQNLFGLVRSIAETDVTVLIQGETGTGKELIARAIHYNSSRRTSRFVAINCGALSETLLESELFGHEKGAFTGATTQRKGIFEAADGGTLFLDEIGETSPSTQVKLLRVLQDGELQRVGGSDTLKVDVRVIAATNRNLPELAGDGRFRQDLFYRLNVFPILLPSLRERTEDIPLLVSHFIAKNQGRLNKEIKGVTSQAMALLIAHPWPGNVRELENVIQRTMVIAKGELLDAPGLPAEIRGKVNESKTAPKDFKEMARESAKIMAKSAILDALSKTGGNITRAAKVLGISRATLQNKMRDYGLRKNKE